MEPLSAVCLVVGWVLLVASWLLLLQMAFSDEYSWGLCALFLPPVAYCFGLFHWRTAKEPMLMALLGWLLVLLG